MIHARDATARIRKALRSRSGKAWSATVGRGTGYGWITIASPPRRRVDGHYMSEADCDELARLLGLPQRVHFQGAIVSPEAREAYVARAETGRLPTTEWTIGFCVATDQFSRAVQLIENNPDAARKALTSRRLSHLLTAPDREVRQRAMLAASTIKRAAPKLTPNRPRRH